MQPELLTPEYDESEIDERAVRRAELIRRKYGSLAAFLKALSKARAEANNEPVQHPPTREAARGFFD